MKILILCTGNSCRSQMAQGWLQAFDKKLQVYSAGTAPSSQVNPLAIQVMAENSIDISNHTPKDVQEYLEAKWDYVITVCGDADHNCPAFVSNVKNRLHIGFDDPSHLSGDPDFVLNEFRRVRDEIRKKFYHFYIQNCQTTI